MSAFPQPLALLAAGLLAAILVSPVSAHPHPEALETDLMPYPFWTEPIIDDIYHVPTGTKLSFEGMMDMMSGGRVVFVGETHNNIHSHRMQLEIIKDLSRRFPGKVAVGMEMFREPQQESLDRWTRGDLTESEFLKESRWFEYWSSNFGYYRDIMNFARDSGLDVVALNPPLELQRAVGMSAPGDMPPEVARDLPEIDSSDPYQRALIRAVYGAHEGGERMQEAFLRVHLLWEEHMAERIVEYLDSPAGEGKIMVVLTGGAHVQYGFGVPKKVVRRRPLPYYVVLPATIGPPRLEREGEQLYMNVEMPEIPLLSSDFIWAVPYDVLDDREVRMGIKVTDKEEGVAVSDVLEGSPASRAGIRPGDLILYLDSLEIEETRDVVLVIKNKRVGDTVRIVVRRDDRELPLSAHFTEPAG